MKAISFLQNASVEKDHFSAKKAHRMVCICVLKVCAIPGRNRIRTHDLKCAERDRWNILS